MGSGIGSPLVRVAPASHGAGEPESRTPCKEGERIGGARKQHGRGHDPLVLPYKISQAQSATTILDMIGKEVDGEMFNDINMSTTSTPLAKFNQRRKLIKAWRCNQPLLAKNCCQATPNSARERVLPPGPCDRILGTGRTPWKGNRMRSELPAGLGKQACLAAATRRPAVAATS